MPAGIQTTMPGPVFSVACCCRAYFIKSYLTLSKARHKPGLGQPCDVGVVGGIRTVTFDILLHLVLLVLPLSYELMELMSFSY